MVSFQRSHHAPQAIAASQRLQSQCSENEVNFTIPFPLLILILPPLPFLLFLPSSSLQGNFLSSPTMPKLPPSKHMHFSPFTSAPLSTHYSDAFQVFKLVGPALMRQELAEVCSFVVVIQTRRFILLQASSNVQKRIEFIKAELKRADARVTEVCNFHHFQSDLFFFCFSHFSATKTQNSFPFLPLSA